MRQGLTKLRQKALSALYLCLVLAATHSVFWQVKTFDMLVYDDLEHIVYNPAVSASHEGPDWDLIWRKPYFDLYVPVAYTMWALVVDQTTALADRQVDPLTLSQNRALVSALHATNLYLHEICTGLVFVLLLTLGASASGAVVGALFFALHPLQVESIAWISEGRGLLASALGLAALILWLRGMRRLDVAPDAQHFQRPYVFWLRMGMAWCLFLASVLAKPSTVTLPGIGIICAMIATKSPLRRICLYLLPWLLTGLVISGITAFLQNDLVSPWPWWERGLLAVDAFVFYLRQLFWPTTLLPDYGRQPTFDATLTAALLVGGSFFLGLTIVAVKKTRSVLALAPLLMFALGLSPHLGLFPSLYQSVSTVADRYTYLALLGPAYGVSLGWSWVLDRKKQGWKACLIASSGLWLGMLLNKTISQLPLWQSTERLFTYNASQSPTSFTAPHALGDLAMIQGDVKKAANYYRQAIQARPLFAQGYASLGHALLDDKNPQEAKLALTQAVALNNQNPSALLNLGVSLQRTGDITGATEKYLAVNTLSPHPLAYFNLGSIYLQGGDLGLAESAFFTALKLNPRLHQAHLQLSVLYDRRGQTQERDRHRHEAAALRDKL